MTKGEGFGSLLWQISTQNVLFPLKQNRGKHLSDISGLVHLCRQDHVRHSCEVRVPHLSCQVLECSWSRLSWSLSLAPFGGYVPTFLFCTLIFQGMTLLPSAWYVKHQVRQFVIHNLFKTTPWTCRKSALPWRSLSPGPVEVLLLHLSPTLFFKERK